jgi:mono/diheme cytochrome c family protein
MRSYTLVAAAALAVALCGCGRTPKSASGFRLPDGDPERGRAAFVALRCNECHQLEGSEPEEQVTGLAKPVKLGGETLYTRTDGELLTAIVNPSHRIAEGYPRELVTIDGKSRMRDYSDTMTVRQLVDIVAFLHTRYRTVPPPMPMP